MEAKTLRRCGAVVRAVENGSSFFYFAYSRARMSDLLRFFAPLMICACLWAVKRNPLFGLGMSDGGGGAVSVTGNCALQRGMEFVRLLWNPGGLGQKS